MQIDSTILAAVIAAVVSIELWQVKLLFSLGRKVASLEAHLADLPCSQCNERKRIVPIRRATGLAGLALVLCLLSAGCLGGVRAKGGRLSHQTAAGAKVETLQPENPKDGASQSTEAASTTEMELPAGTVVEVTKVLPGPEGHFLTNSTRITLMAPSAYRETRGEKAESKVGGAQKDTIGETIAKLKASRWLTIFGAVAFLGGVFCAFYPAVALVMGGKTPGLVIAGGGLVLAFLPFVVIGHETLLMCLAATAALITLGAVWLHHHGGVSGELRTLKAAFSPPASTASTEAVKSP